MQASQLATFVDEHAMIGLLQNIRVGRAVVEESLVTCVEVGLYPRGSARRRLFGVKSCLWSEAERDSARNCTSSHRRALIISSQTSVSCRFLPNPSAFSVCFGLQCSPFFQIVDLGSSLQMTGETFPDH